MLPFKIVFKVMQAFKIKYIFHNLHEEVALKLFERLVNTGPETYRSSTQAAS
jgi:hypothetical protein